MTLREKMQVQLNLLPESLLREVADFTAFIMARHRIESPYSDWQEGEWSRFALDHLLRESDDKVEYTIADAEEVYKS
ncbi:MAG: hypothetical protein WAU10_19140 [Caldilineaceae bacterium]